MDDSTSGGVRFAVQIINQNSKQKKYQNITGTQKKKTHTHTHLKVIMSLKKKNLTYFLKDFYGSNKRPQELSRDHEKEGRNKKIIIITHGLFGLPEYSV